MTNKARDTFVVKPVSGLNLMQEAQARTDNADRMVESADIRSRPFDADEKPPQMLNLFTSPHGYAALLRNMRHY